MARGRKVKHETVELEADLPTPNQSQASSQMAHVQDPRTTEMPVRSGSQTAGLTSPTPTMATDSTHSMRADAGDGDRDVEMGESSSPGSEAMQVLGDQSRELIQVIQKLEALNIQSTLPSLPMFVVIGDQSAGKSSIIEAACDISLPRDEGTCTRCPFKITTTDSRAQEQWQCKVSLHFDFAYEPRALAGRGSTFEKWLDQDRTTRHFVTLYSKSDLGAALRRAQLAILNPEKDYRTFVDMPLTAQAVESQQVNFSPNIINLEIMAPGLPELSFIDLPGAINTVPDESQQYLVHFIEVLLKGYLSKSKAYILLACAANQDMETSTAFKFLRGAKATNRAMGILTKPDLMDLDHPARISFIRGLLLRDNWRIGDGWFITRQLSQKEIVRDRISHAEARQIEADFFANKPWITELGDFGNRLGIQNLASAISQKLTKHILNDLPEIMQRVQSRLETVNKELASFPEQAVAPVLTVIAEIGRLKTAIDNELSADSHTSSFRKPYRLVFNTFAEKLKSLRPIVRVASPGYQKPSISLSSDEEETPSKSQRTNGHGSRFMSTTPASGGKFAQPRPRRTPANSSSDVEIATKTVFFLDKVKADFDSAPGADIPGQSSDVVVKNLIKSTMKGWSSIVDDGVVKRVDAILLDMLQETSSATLSQYHNTEFLRQVNEATFSLLKELMADVCAWVYAFVASETHRPITLNGELMKQKRLGHEADLCKRRNDARTDEHFETMESEGYKVPPKVEQKKKAESPEWVKEKLGDDEYDREVKSLAIPLAYYAVASAQLVDVIARHFEHGLLHSFQSRLHTKLCEHLQVQDPNYCAQLLAEDSETERKRAELSIEKGKLEQALAELVSLKTAYA